MHLREWKYKISKLYQTKQSRYQNFKTIHIFGQQIHICVLAKKLKSKLVGITRITTSLVLISY